MRRRSVFIGLHGGAGENGEVQAIFERQSCLSASGAQASRMAFHKDDGAKKVMREAVFVWRLLFVPPADDVKRGRQVLDEMVARYGRAVMKPNADGSSHGLFIVENDVQKENALFWMSTHPKMGCLVEAFIRGREMTTGVVMMNGQLQALPSSEVIMETGRVFDYEGKYLGAGSTEVTPAANSRRISWAVGSTRLQGTCFIGLLWLFSNRFSRR